MTQAIFYDASTFETGSATYMATSMDGPGRWTVMAWEALNLSPFGKVDWDAALMPWVTKAVEFATEARDRARTAWEAIRYGSISDRW